jgi:threonine/homoserine/homoserine lactone efflux protein
VTTGQIVQLLGQGMFVGVALAAPIGPINIEIVRRGLSGGFVHGWLVGVGALSADTIYATLVVSGLTPLADRPALRVPLFLAGAAMLGYVGYLSLRAALRDEESVAAVPAGGRRSYVTGFFMAAFNPMGIVYWLSIGAALVASAVAQVGRAGSPMLVGGVFVGIFCWVTFLSAVGQVGRRFITGLGFRIITGLGGALIVAFGLWFFLQALVGLGWL